MTATPVRPDRVAAPRRSEPETVTTPSAQHSGAALLLGLLGVLLAFAALPLALSHPALGLAGLLVAVALLLVLMTRRVEHPEAHGEVWLGEHAPTDPSYRSAEQPVPQR